MTTSNVTEHVIECARLRSEARTLRDELLDVIAAFEKNSVPSQQLCTKFCWLMDARSSDDLQVAIDIVNDMVGRLNTMLNEMSDRDNTCINSVND